MEGVTRKTQAIGSGVVEGDVVPPNDITTSGNGDTARNLVSLLSRKTLKLLPLYVIF